MFRLDTRWKWSVQVYRRHLPHSLSRVCTHTSVINELISCLRKLHTCRRLRIHISAREALIAEGDRKASTIRFARFSCAFLRSPRNRWDRFGLSLWRKRKREKGGIERKEHVVAETDGPTGDSTNAVNHRGCSKSRLFPRSCETHAISLFYDAFRIITLPVLRDNQRKGEFSKRARDRLHLPTNVFIDSDSIK